MGAVTFFGGINLDLLSCCNSIKRRAAALAAAAVAAVVVVVVVVEGGGGGAEEGSVYIDVLVTAGVVPPKISMF